MRSLASKANRTSTTVYFLNGPNANLTSAEGMLDKAKFMLDEMERRMGAFAGTWEQTTDVQLYTVLDCRCVHVERVVEV